MAHETATLAAYVADLKYGDIVEKLDGAAGDKITLGDVVIAGDGGDLKSTDGLTVAAEIVAQAKGEKVTVFKKRRRHNYRRKKGHRQQHTILKIVAIGDHKEQKKAAPKAESTPAKPADAAPAKENKPKAVADAQKSSDVAGTPTENPAPADKKAANAPKGAAKKAAPAKAKAESGSTKNAAAAKGAKKAPKGK